MINLTWQQEFNANFSMPLSFCRHKWLCKTANIVYPHNSGVLAAPESEFKSELPNTRTMIFFQHPLGTFSPLFDTII